MPGPPPEWLTATATATATAHVLSSPSRFSLNVYRKVLRQLWGCEGYGRVCVFIPKYTAGQQQRKDRKTLKRHNRIFLIYLQTANYSILTIKQTKCWKYVLETLGGTGWYSTPCSWCCEWDQVPVRTEPHPRSRTWLVSVTLTTGPTTSLEPLAPRCICSLRAVGLSQTGRPSSGPDRRSASCVTVRTLSQVSRFIVFLH